MDCLWKNSPWWKAAETFLSLAQQQKEELVEEQWDHVDPFLGIQGTRPGNTYSLISWIMVNYCLHFLANTGFTGSGWELDLGHPSAGLGGERPSDFVLTYSSAKCISVFQMGKLIWWDLLGGTRWRRQWWECPPHACCWSQVGVWIWRGKIWMVRNFVGTCWEAVQAELESHPRLRVLAAKICKQVAQPWDTFGR